MTRPDQLRARAAEMREAAQRQVAIAENRAKVLEAKADERERREAKRALVADFRRRANQAAQELAALTARRDELVVQRDAVVEKHRQLTGARDSATSQAAAFQSQITHGIESASAPKVIAELRAKQDALRSVASEYAGPIASMDSQVESLDREIDAMTYPIQHAEDERDRYAELALDPDEDAKRAAFEANRARLLEERARAAREQANDDRIRRHVALERLPPTWPRR
jgi:chromosome segregation ATPase